MANKVQKPCKSCGKMFTPCADCESDKTIFRWKRVACSPACAKAYFAKIEASRQPKVESGNSQIVQTKSIDSANSNSEGTTESIKPKRTRKKNIENEESEQIG